MKDDFSLKGEVIDALMGVTAPSGDKNIVDAHIVENIDINGGVADITLTMGKEHGRDERFELEDKIYDAVEAIAKSPSVGSLISLDLSANRITDRGLEALARSEHLGQLRELKLQYNQYTKQGLMALIDSERLSLEVRAAAVERLG